MYSTFASPGIGRVNATLDPPPQPDVSARKIGVLLSNLGTPDGTDYWSVRRYLAEFLSDSRVIELPRALWLPLLHGVVLSLRPKRKGHDYRAVWNNDTDESPLKTITRSQAHKLRQRLDAKATEGGVEVVVEWGMRYGNPSIEAAVQRLLEQGCDRILLVPLYPQYSATTTATACDKLFDVMKRMRRQPSLRVAPPYYEDPTYIAEIARSISHRVAKLDFKPEVIIASFHGIPQRNVAKGDPYYEQCQRTGELLREALGLSSEQFLVTYQSRFGFAKWLTPYTDATVKRLAREGIRRIAVVAPGFPADCIETVDELARENAEYFLSAGGEHLEFVRGLNDSEGGIRVIESLVWRELQGWV